MNTPLGELKAIAETYYNLWIAMFGLKGAKKLLTLINQKVQKETKRRTIKES